MSALRFVSAIFTKDSSFCDLLHTFLNKTPFNTENGSAVREKNLLKSTD